MIWKPKCFQVKFFVYLWWGYVIYYVNELFSINGIYKNLECLVLTQVYHKHSMPRSDAGVPKHSLPRSDAGVQKHSMPSSDAIVAKHSMPSSDAGVPKTQYA